MIFTSPNLRVFGIDWLEVFASEDPTRDYTPDGFRRRGWFVEERGYGTKTMSQMFKLLDNSMNPFVEIRRAPRGLQDGRKLAVYQMGDCYLRFDNMYCYDKNPMILMNEFMEREGYTFRKIYRLDLFLDIVKFDTNDTPSDVMRRIVTHRYAKINQTKRRLAGDDMWEGCEDNWIAWGAPGSMVGTKFYNKTKELKDTGMKKPWIVEMWRQAGYIDNSYTLSKESSDVNVWRLEFALKSSSKGWVHASKEEKAQGISYRLPHNPLVYSDPKGVFNAIVNLIPYYFRFKIYEEGKVKSDCKDKILFRFGKNEAEFGYRLTSESDIDRVRRIPMDEYQTALYYVNRAKLKLWGTPFASQIVALSNDLMNETNRRSALTYTKRTDIF